MKFHMKPLGAILAVSMLPVLQACGSDGQAVDPASGIGINASPNSAQLSELLAQGLINAQALDLDDNAVRETDDTQDAFDL